VSGDRIGVRTGETLRSVVLSYGELSAATRALLIIAAVELGTPVAQLDREIAAVVGGTLQPAVRARLLALLNTGSTPVEHVPPAAPASEFPAGGDIFDTGYDL
jgi:hypothetical protein